MRVFLSWLSSFACQFLGTYMHTLVYEHISVSGVILPKLLYYISVLLSPYCICVFRESPSDTDQPVGSSLNWYFKVESLHKVAFKGVKPHPLTRCGGRYLSDSSCKSMHGKIFVSMWLHSFVFAPSGCVSSVVMKNVIRGHNEGTVRSRHHHLLSARVLSYWFWHRRSSQMSSAFTQIN